MPNTKPLSMADVARLGELVATLKKLEDEYQKSTYELNVLIAEYRSRENV